MIPVHTINFAGFVNANAACERVVRSFYAYEWGDIIIYALNDEYAYVNDGNYAWFARISELEEIGERPEDHEARGDAYSDWCGTHKPLRLNELPENVQEAAAIWGTRPLVDTF